MNYSEIILKLINDKRVELANKHIKELEQRITKLRKKIDCEYKDHCVTIDLQYIRCKVCDSIYCTECICNFAYCGGICEKCNKYICEDCGIITDCCETLVCPDDIKNIKGICIKCSKEYCINCSYGEEKCIKCQKLN